MDKNNIIETRFANATPEQSIKYLDLITRQLISMYDFNESAIADLKRIVDSGHGSAHVSAICRAMQTYLAESKNKTTDYIEKAKALKAEFERKAAKGSFAYALSADSMDSHISELRQIELKSNLEFSNEIIDFRFIVPDGTPLEDKTKTK